MKTPKFTDLHRFPVPYKPARETNIKETFDRITERERLNAEERLRKTIQLRKAK